MANITITLTTEELENLYALVKENSDTGNGSWEESIKSVEKKLREKL